MSLFPPESGRHLQWGPAAPGRRKTVTTALRPATAADYHRHLATEALAGPGAIGVSPTRLDSQGRLVCGFVALDLDTLTVDTFPTSVLDTLEGLGVQGYVTRGSTGRGSHLYIFLKGSLPVAEAFGAITGIAHLMREARPGSTTEQFPSNPSTPGKAIFLPYRGAATDGYGANPLLDPRAGLAPIALDDAQSCIKRTAADALYALGSVRISGNKRASIATTTRRLPVASRRPDHAPKRGPAPHNLLALGGAQPPSQGLHRLRC